METSEQFLNELQQFNNDSKYFTVSVMNGKTIAPAATLVYSSLIWEKVVAETLQNKFGYGVVTATTNNFKYYQLDGVDIIGNTPDGKTEVLIDFKNLYRKNGTIPLGKNWRTKKTEVYVTYNEGMLYFIPKAVIIENEDKIATSNYPGSEFETFPYDICSNDDIWGQIEIDLKYRAIMDKYASGKGEKLSSIYKQGNQRIIDSILTPEFKADYKATFGVEPMVLLQ